MPHRPSPLQLFQITVIIAIAVVPTAVSANAAESKAVMAYFESSGSGSSLHAFHRSINQIPTDTFGVDIHGTVSGTAPTAASVRQVNARPRR